MPSQGASRTGEPQINLLLAGALDARHPRWTVGAEQTRTVRGAPGRRPDIVIRHPVGQPLIIESEIEPASTVEAEARSRLGVALDAGGDRVQQAIALQIPVTLTYVAQRNLPTAVERARYRYASLYRTADGITLRWPTRGWLEGTIDDLANLCENVALSEQVLAAGMARLQQAVEDIVYRLRRIAPPGVLTQMAAELRQEDGEQSFRMSAAILLNAVTFHTAIAGHHDIPSFDQLRDPFGRPSKRRLVKCWEEILRVNYWPIFHIANRLLLPLPDAVAIRVLEVAVGAATDLVGIGVTTMHDLAGRMFQQLIADRKFLATFYTLPASAAMIAELATARLDTDWADEKAVTGLRIADLACGTGPLLSAAYQAIRSRHRRVGGDDSAIHARMMEDGLIGADVMPQAAHLTASMLSSAHPSIPFGNTQVYTLPYGVGDNQEVSIGSLDLLGLDALASLFATGERQIHGRGEQGRMELRRESLDMVIDHEPAVHPPHQSRGDRRASPRFRRVG